ncbi:unnamed protein product [Bemisia tabaci]|uniref:SUZ RNA-binding domain-containing n=2 Tax=Bemisia tabaci TaxID=7038 RepID=A0A9P0A6F8_BEMTA|nr:unnamed protein product [Bemisia tabaci]
MASSEKPVVFDNWEELEPEALKEQLASRVQASSAMNGEVATCPIPSQGPDDVQMSEEARARCGIPPVPIVKILKRPSQRQNSSMGGGDGLLLNGDTSKPRFPIKTLQQREEAYAQARLRILGEAQSPDEDLPQDEEKIISIARILNKVELGTPNSRLNNEEGQDSGDKVAVDMWESSIPSNNTISNLSSSEFPPLPTDNTAACSSNLYNVNSLIQSKNEETTQSTRVSESNIIRQPRGPSETNGFSLQR